MLQMESPEKRSGPAQAFVGELQQIAIFAELLELYLVRKAVKQAHLAEKLFVHPATVHNWRKNKRLPDNLGIVYRASQVLKLSPFESENLIQAWRFSRAVRDLVPFIEEADRNGDAQRAIQLAKSILDGRNQQDGEQGRAR